MAVAQVSWLQVAPGAIAQVSWLEVAPPAPSAVAQVSWLQVSPGAVNYVMNVEPGVFTWVGASSNADYEIDVAPGVFTFNGAAAGLTHVPYVPGVDARIPPRRLADLNNPVRRRPAT